MSSDLDQTSLQSSYSVLANQIEIIVCFPTLETKHYEYLVVLSH